MAAGAPRAALGFGLMGGMGKQLKIIQLNTWHGRYLPNIISWLQQEQPDVVCLEEVTTGNMTTAEAPFANADVFATLRDSLGYHGFFAPTWRLVLPDGSEGAQGNAILSRHEFQEQEGVMYDKPLTTLNRYPEQQWHNGEEPRNFVAATLSLPGGKQLRVIATHLHWNVPCAEDDRRVAEAKALVDFTKQRKHLPTILCGDFNIFPESETLRTLTSIHTWVPQWEPQLCGRLLTSRVLNFQRKTTGNLKK